MLASNLVGLMILAVPAAVLLGMIDASKSQVCRDGLGRLGLLVTAIGFAVIAMRVMHPRTGILAEHLARDGAAWMTRGIWHAAFWLTPLGLGLGLLAASGYYDAALRLQARIAFSLVITVLVLLTYGVFMRELLVARRRIEVRRIPGRREKARASAGVQQTAEASGDAAPQIPDSEEIDVASMSEQTRALLHMVALAIIAAGLWLVWRDMLPTLGILDDVALWTQTISTEAGTKIVPVTLSNILLALIIGVATFVA